MRLISVLLSIVVVTQILLMNGIDGSQTDASHDSTGKGSGQFLSGQSNEQLGFNGENDERITIIASDDLGLRDKSPKPPDLIETDSASLLISAMSIKTYRLALIRFSGGGLPELEDPEQYNYTLSMRATGQCALDHAAIPSIVVGIYPIYDNWDIGTLRNVGIPRHATEPIGITNVTNIQAEEDAVWKLNWKFYSKENLVAALSKGFVVKIDNVWEVRDGTCFFFSGEGGAAPMLVIDKSEADGWRNFLPLITQPSSIRQ